jgi:hypothetical protein
VRQKGYSEAFIAFIDKALEKDQANGFQTAAEALQEAQSLIHKKTGLTTMKKQIAVQQKQLKKVLQNQEVVVEKLDENQALLREQGVQVTAMASRFTNLEADMKVAMCHHRMQMRMLEAGMRDETSCPSLFWIMPKPKVRISSLLTMYLSPSIHLLSSLLQAKGMKWLGSLAKASTWLYDKVLVCFVCPHGMHVVPCGPSGSGYEMQMTKEWVKKWGPMILITCSVIRTCLAAGQVMGLPLPLTSVESIRPNMDDGAKRSLMQQQMEVVQGMESEAKV